MERKAAEAIIPKLAAAASLISETVELLRPFASAEETKLYARSVGAALMAVQWDLMRPIFHEYPDLNPYEGQSDKH